MGKLTRAQSSAHKQALTLLEKDVLTLDEKIFVYENWHEGADSNNAALGAFFTPFGLANDFGIDVHGNKILDICAGIGILSFCYYHFKAHYDEKPEITCIEINPKYVEVGKKLFPEANWICADIFEIWKDLPKDYTSVISNPPFGNKIGKGSSSPIYTGSEFEYKIIDIASHLTKYGVFIVPQSSAGFKYSGAPYYDRVSNSKFDKFYNDTSLWTETGCGIDTSYYGRWKDVFIITEVICIDFENKEKRTS